VKLASRDLILVPSLVKRIFRVSLYAIGQFLITTTSWIVLIRIIALFGTAPVAAYTVTLRLMEFVWLPCWGLGNATATLVGQNLGAKKPERAKQTVWEGAKYNLMLMTLLGLIQVIFAPQIISLFSTEQEVIRHGINCLRIIGAGFPAYAIGMIIIQSLNGAGDMITPSIMNFICFWLIQIPLAYWLSAIVNVGPSGVFIAIIFSETLLTVMAVWFFRKDSWLKQQI
jgi:Na+-driven multidrug efflux pump